MTEAMETVILAEALEVIDQALRSMQERELVSSNEMSDLLLDLRMLLAPLAAPAEPSPLGA